VYSVTASIDSMKVSQSELGVVTVPQEHWQHLLFITICSPVAGNVFGTIVSGLQ